MHPYTDGSFKQIANNTAPRAKLTLPYRVWLHASQTLRMFGYDPYNSATAAAIYKAVVYGAPCAT